MKASLLFKQYVWLVDTIRRAGRITLNGINHHWLRTEMSEGVPYSRTTFRRHRQEVEEMFGIVIDCDNDNRYYIDDPSLMNSDSVSRWMLSTLAVSNIVSEARGLHDRILLESIPSESNHLQQVIDALSDIASSFSRYAKLPENHPAPLDLAELVGNVVNLYDNAENITFVYCYDKTKDHTYNGDKTNLNSAVGNLVKNAVQAIGTKPDGKIEVRLTSTEKAFTIAVKDNGKGIKEEDKSQIFLPNFTTKTGGSGVGLSLTYNIVQAAGGTISFESQENVGTEFTIELPR